jgi:hypothetical protein
MRGERHRSRQALIGVGVDDQLGEALVGGGPGEAGHRIGDDDRPPCAVQRRGAVQGEPAERAAGDQDVELFAAEPPGAAGGEDSDMELPVHWCGCSAS